MVRQVVEVLHHLAVLQALLLDGLGDGRIQHRLDAGPIGCLNGGGILRSEVSSREKGKGERVLHEITWERGETRYTGRAGTV